MIVAFDIGKKNFAFTIIQIDTSSLETISNIPSNTRYNTDKSGTPEFRAILDKVFDCSQIILYRNIDLTENCNSKKTLDPISFLNMNRELNEYTDYWDKCSYFLIEQQMAFRGRCNIMALKLAQHCYSYFCNRYNRVNNIIDYPAYYKTQIIGAAKSLVNTKPKRKKWAIAESISILENRSERCDTENTLLEFLNKRGGKKDDISDTYLMTLTFSYMKYLDKKY